MSNETTYYNLRKPETNDPVDIDADWNTNLELVDNALEDKEPYLNQAIETWQLSSNYFIETSPGYEDLDRSFNLYLNIEGRESVFDAAKAAVGQFQFTSPGFYYVEICGRAQSVDPITDAKIALSLSNATCVPHNFDLKQYINGTIVVVTIRGSDIIRVWDPADDPGNIWDVTTNDILTLNARWVGNPTTAAGTLFLNSTYITAHRIR